MVEVDAAARQRAKEQARKMARLDNYISAVLGIAAVLVPLPPHKIAFGVGAGLMRLMATYRQSLADDPPTQDYDVVWQSSAAMLEEQVPGTEPEATFHRFAATLVVLSDETWALIRALERYDGAVTDGAADWAQAQADAVAANAQLAADNQDLLRGLCLTVNDHWATLRQDAAMGWSDVTIEEVRQLYYQAYGEPPDAPAQPLADLTTTITDTNGVLDPYQVDLPHPILDTDELPSEPDTLFDDDYLSELDELTAALRGLAG
jgi:hypothetical protein